jgi:WD40 repeat protein
VAYLLDSKRLITGSDGNFPIIWSLEDGEQIVVLQHERAYPLACSQDAAQIMTTSRIDKAARVWNGNDGTLEFVLNAASFAWSAAFSPDQSRIATVHEDGCVRIWDAHDGRQLLVISGERGRVPVRRTVFTSDGTCLALFGYGSPQLLDTRTLPQSSQPPGTRLPLVQQIMEHEHDSGRRRDRDSKDSRATVRRLALEVLARKAQEPVSWILSVLEGDPIALCSGRLSSAIARDTLHSEEVRSSACAIANELQSPARLNRLAWQVVSRSSGTSKEDLDLALCMASRAAELAPSSGDCLNTLGVAQYRAGHYAEALQTLTRSNEANGGNQVPDLAFLNDLLRQPTD